MLAHALYGNYFKGRNGRRKHGRNYVPYYYKYRFKYPTLYEFENHFVTTYAEILHGHLKSAKIGTLQQPDGDDNSNKGYIVHLFHGSKTNRQYEERFTILTKHRFNPETDIVPDANGPLTFSQYALKEKPEMVKDINNMFQKRKEDEK